MRSQTFDDEDDEEEDEARKRAGRRLPEHVGKGAHSPR